MSTLRLGRSVGVAVLGLTLSSGIALAAAGDFDPSFNRLGLTRLQGISGQGLTIQRTDEIVGAGVRGTNLILWRQATDGSFDARFGDKGIVSLAPVPGHFGSGFSLAVDSQNRIVLVTIAFDNPPPTAYHIVYRFNFDGSPDLSFSGTGSTTVPIGTRFYAVTGVAIQPDNKVSSLSVALSIQRQTDGNFSYTALRRAAGWIGVLAALASSGRR